MQYTIIPRKTPIGKALLSMLYPQHYNITARTAHIQHTNITLTVPRVCQNCATSHIRYGSNARYVPTIYTCISRNNSFAHQTWQFNTILRRSLPSHITVRTVRMLFTLLFALYEAYLRKTLWEMCASVQIIPHILPIITTPFTDCMHKHITNEYAEAISTLLTHSMNTVHYYCPHCTPQYSTVRNVPISIRILRPLHHSLFYSTQCSHQHPSTAHTAPLNIPLCAVYLSESKYYAHCTTQCSTVRNVPISIRILGQLHYSVLHCGQCTHQHPSVAHSPHLRTALCAMYPTAFKYCPHCTH